ncbi:ACP phosphodiesterase [Odoribacter sp. OttesenSCG-928-J03]|nr:ACP phosphodiesterase [Odoribacter sp. OttesenSCG-928-J03]MDL2331290.1 ACP phosphodiesterase [Odoribacter sp. OttesenSCG-928-A06]
MNYLAHIFLSGNNPGVQIGNFVGDAVKGKSYNNYPADIREGILLHRAIDDFADKHPVVKETVQLLRPHFGRYSAALTDIYFDFFLAINFSTYSSVSLRRFAFRFYGHTIWKYRSLPPRFKNFLWHFILTNRLCKYARTEGIRESLEIMTRYKKFEIDPDYAIKFLLTHQEILQQKFSLFFPDLQLFCRIGKGTENRMNPGISFTDNL